MEQPPLKKRRLLEEAHDIEPMEVDPPPEDEPMEVDPSPSGPGKHYNIMLA